MAIDVSSWFVAQSLARASRPKRVFTVGGSDYSQRVTRWPSFKRTANEIKSINLSVPLANTDGGLNHFYENTYNMQQACAVQLGFTHPESGDELVTIYSGFLKNVSYSGKHCTLKLKDRLWSFTERKVGDSDNPVTFGTQLPSDVAWTLCTCYGELSAVQSTSNPDIDYDSFALWAATFSADTVQCQARYEGQKITEALERLGRMTDSAVWIEGDGKVTFRRFTEPDSRDFVLTRDEYTDLAIDVEGLRLQNRQHVYWDYAPASDYWQRSVVAEDDTSVNTFGVHEDVIKDPTVWYVNTDSALNLAQRKVLLLKQPPKRFDVKTGLVGIQHQLGETVRLVDPFCGITSGSGWRFVEQQIDLDRGQARYEMDEATTANAFYLDVSYLDGDDRLL